MDKLANLFNTSEAFRRDFLTALGIWLGLEGVALAVFFTLGIHQVGERLHNWLFLSLILGVMGAFLLALSPQSIARDRLRRNRWARGFRILAWRLLAWLGLVGLAFPLLMLSYEVFFFLFDQLIQG